MDRLTSLEFFVAAANHQSFSVAARYLDTSPASVSRAVQQLEQRLNTRLFDRTTRKVMLTDDGRIFYERCQQILSDLEEVELALSKSQTSVRGTLRLNLAVGFGKRYIVPALPQLEEQYPNLNIEVHLSDRYTDLIEERIDASVRVGHSPDSQLIIRPLTQARLMVCATPNYWQQHGKPKTPEDLERHNCLNFIEPNTNHLRQWIFESNGDEIQLPLKGNLSFSDPEALLETALAGIGVVQTYDFMVYPAIAQGLLEPVLAAYTPSSVPFAVLYLPKRHLSAKVRAFVEFMQNIVVDLKQQGFIS